MDTQQLKLRCKVATCTICNKDIRYLYILSVCLEVTKYLWCELPSLGFDGGILKELWNFKHILRETDAFWKFQLLTHEGYTALRCSTEINTRIFPFSLLYLAASTECINKRATLPALALTSASSKQNLQVDSKQRSVNTRGSIASDGPAGNGLDQPPARAGDPPIHTSPLSME